MDTISKSYYSIFNIIERFDAKYNYLSRRFTKYVLIGPSLLRRNFNLAKIKNAKQIIPNTDRVAIQFVTRRHWQPMKWK